MAELNKIEELVKSKYIVYYPHWKNIRITETIKIDSGGNYCVVKATENNVDTEGEICYINNESKVTIFSSTEELVRFFAGKYNRKWYNQLISKSGVSAIVTLVLLITLCILVFRPNAADKQVLQIIGGAFLAAIGFLFGTTSGSKRD